MRNKSSIDFLHIWIKLEEVTWFLCNSKNNLKKIIFFLQKTKTFSSVDDPITQIRSIILPHNPPFRHEFSLKCLKFFSAIQNPIKAISSSPLEHVITYVNDKKMSFLAHLCYATSGFKQRSNISSRYNLFMPSFLICPFLFYRTN